MYKELLQELMKAIDSGVTSKSIRNSSLAVRIDAALEQPILEGPSDEDVLRVAANELDYVIGPPWNFDAVPMSADDVLAIVRAALARWGNYPAQPDSSPASPASGDLYNATDLQEQRHPAPPAKGEVEELVAFLLWQASGLGHYGHGKRGRLLLTRAADLLAQCHLVPVPILEN